MELLKFVFELKKKSISKFDLADMSKRYLAFLNKVQFQSWVKLTNKALRVI